MRRWSIVIVLLLVLGFAGFQPEISQAQVGDTCTALVQEALAAIGNNCGGLGRNSACYGFNHILATFTNQKPTDFFSQPADLAQIFDIQSLSTAPLSVDSAEWGIAVLNVQANLPDALPGESVKFLLFGDVDVENAVDPGIQAVSTPVLMVTTIEDAVMRTRPASQANMTATIPSGTELEADQRSTDGDWVRVVYDDLAGWLPLASVDQVDQLTRLLTVDRVPYTPMQAIRLRTNLMGISCADAPPSLAVVQGPQQMTISLNVNGANLSIGSTIALWTTETPDGPAMVLAVIDGGVYLDDGTYIPAGFIAEVMLDAAGNVTGVWSAPRPMTLEEWLLLEPLEGVPGNILNYPIVVPSELIASLEPTPTPTPIPTAVPVVPPSVPLTTPDIVQVDCGALRPTSPLGGLPSGAVTFYWDGVASPLVTGYRVNVYRDGALVAGYNAPANQTHVAGDLSSVPLLGMYTWEVQALVNGIAICTVGTSVSQRAFPTDAPSAAATAVVSPEPTAEITPEPTSEVTPEPTAEVTSEPTPEVTRDSYCNYNEICEEGEDLELCSDCFSEAVCGNEICEKPYENPETCPSDCSLEETFGINEASVVYFSPRGG